MDGHFLRVAQIIVLSNEGALFEQDEQQSSLRAAKV
jgi:hypothetical protein